MYDDDATHALLVEFARRKGERVAAVVDGVFEDHGFAWRGGDDRRFEIARQIRALRETGNLAVDLTTVVTAVLGHFGHPYDRADVHAAVTRHLDEVKP
jgi:hypothetical protein